MYCLTPRQILQEGGRQARVPGAQGCASLRRCRSALARGPPADRSFEKQLPVNKREQKLGPIFKVMSYAESMFLRMGNGSFVVLWHSGEFINNRSGLLGLRLPWEKRRCSGPRRTWRPGAICDPSGG